MSAIIFNGKDAKLLTGRDLLDSGGNAFSKGEKSYTTAACRASKWSTSGAGVTIADDTTAADLPRSTTSPIGQKITGVSGSTDYAYFRFTLDPADYNTKLKVQFAMNPLSGYVSNDFKVDVYSNTASAYNGTSTRLVLSTDSSSVTGLPNATGTFRTTFDAPGSSAPYIEIRIGLNGTNTHACVFSDVIVGPGVAVQGATISDWQSYTPTITGRSSNPTQGTGTTKANWRRVGTVMEIQYSFIQTALGSAAAGSGDYLWSIPSGYTINTSVIDNTASQYASNTVGSAQVYFGDGPGEDEGTVQVDGSSLILVVGTNGVATSPVSSSHRQFSENAAMRYSFNARIPINEWAGNGTVNVVQNDEEYAFNTSTSVSANDTTSFGYGKGGALIQNITAALTRRVRWLTPIQPGDSFIVEVSTDQLKWAPVVGLASPSNAQSIASYSIQNTATYGLGQPGFNNATDMDVYFGTYAYPSGATYGAAGTAWSSGAGGYYWRCRKIKSGQAVGFGAATTTALGLVKLPNSYVFASGSSGYGSATSNKIRHFTTSSTTGGDISYTSDATNGDKFTANAAGMYAVSYSDNFNAAANMGLSLNSANLTTVIFSLAAGEQIANTVTGAANFSGTVFVTLYLNAGDVIRAHTDGTAFGTTTNVCYLRIAKVSP